MVALNNNVLKTELRDFLTNSILPLTCTETFGDGDSFLEKGILDSTGVLELVGHLENHYGVKVESDEITPENLDSLEKLSGYIIRKKADARLTPAAN